MPEEIAPIPENRDPAPLTQEEPSVEIHKPKPVHNWRELLTEIGVVVIGVCIALGAEQTVVALHDHARAAEARANIRAEIARNLAIMDQREDTEACQTKRMAEVDGLIAASAAGKLPQDALWLGQPLTGAMLDSRYKAALQSGAASLFDDAEQAAYASLYANFEIRAQQMQEELRAWADLRTLEDHPSASATLDWQLRSAMKQARLARWSIDSVHAVAVRYAAQVGIQPATHLKVTLPAICVPLHTSRTEAVKQVTNTSARYSEMMLAG